MKINHDIRQQLIQKMQEEFSRTYPFLKIEIDRTRRVPGLTLDSGDLDTDGMFQQPKFHYQRYDSPKIRSYHEHAYGARNAADREQG